MPDTRLLTSATVRVAGSALTEDELLGRRKKKPPRRFQHGGKRRPKPSRPIFGAAPLCVAAVVCTAPGVASLTLSLVVRVVVCAWLRFRYGGFDRIAPGALTSLVLDPVTEVIGRPGVAISEYNPPSPLDIALKLEADESTRAERLGDDALVAPVARPGEAEAEMAAEAAAIGADAVPRKPFLRSGMASACVAVVRCSCCSALMSSSMCVCVCVCACVCRFGVYRAQPRDTMVHANLLPKPPRLTSDDLKVAPVVHAYFECVHHRDMSLPASSLVSRVVALRVTRVEWWCGCVLRGLLPAIWTK